ncbi:hypothetical protein L218DRAFT_955171 [Marasmius fiardii PR-910]|nr:hypothetical protein L218DRAFT_955171 [Marasmius fiardii PR-910]
MLTAPSDSIFPNAQLKDGGRPIKRPRNWPPDSSISYTDSTQFGFLPVDESTSSMETTRLARQDSTSQRTHGQDKGRRLSCKECRRLKLKCDRVFPCQSCRKRGCSDICPEGALTSGRGSRFILANTEQLHAKILQLSDRVRQLEDGLQILQANQSSERHPLLAPELLKVKSTQEFYGTRQPDFLSLETSSAQRDENLRASVGALSLTSNTVSMMDHDEVRPGSFTGDAPEVPADIMQLSTTFPFPWAVDLKIRARIRSALPERKEAVRVCEQARNNALWQYNLDASETFIPNLVHYCYETTIEDLSPRRLALLLMVLSIGSLVDLDRPLGSLHGEAYHHLARASVCEIPLMEEPDFDTLHALFFMIWYHLIFSDNKKAVGYAWNLMGFVAKLAQGLGLHRESSRMKHIPEEHEKRRFIFWELLNLDCRMSLSLGRPPSICLAHVDIKPPSYDAQGLYVPEEEILYHQWKNTFFIQCLSPALETIIAVQPVDYSVTIALDSQIRDFAVPDLLDDRKRNPPPARFLAMQRALLSTGRDIVLLQLHRRYFIQTMSSSVAFELHHTYAPSVLATYLGAASIITAVETLYETEAQLSARFLCFWFNSFSAAVTLSLLVSRAPASPFTACALNDLDRVCRLFRKAAKILPFSAKTLPVMSEMVERARRAHVNWRAQAGIEQIKSDTHLRLGEVGTCIPPSFSGSHFMLRQYLEQLSGIRGVMPLSIPVPPSINTIDHLLPTNNRAWLPDIYTFNSAGIGIEVFATSPPTPFMPSEPRVSSSLEGTLNFDHGALMTDLEETSFMAWF